VTILELLEEDGVARTPKQIANALGKRNAKSVRPALRKLLKAGAVERRKCGRSHEYWVQVEVSAEDFEKARVENAQARWALLEQMAAKTTLDADYSGRKEDLAQLERLQLFDKLSTP